MGRHRTSFSTCFGLKTRGNAELVFEWSRWSLKSLDEAREDARHGRPKTVTSVNGSVVMGSLWAIPTIDRHHQSIDSRNVLGISIEVFHHSGNLNY
jgi:hypothetical protein